MSFGPGKGANEDYRVEGNLIPGPVRGITTKVRFDEDKYNAFYGNQAAVDVTDGRQRGLTRIKNILQAFENESAFEVGNDGLVSPRAGQSSVVGDPMRSAQGTIISQSVAGGFQNMVEQSKKMLFDLKTMEESHSKVAPEVLKFEDIDELPEPLDIEKQRTGKELEAIPEESALNLGDDPLMVTDLAFQEFAARKATIISNISLMASARPDLDVIAKKKLVQQVEKALNQEQARFVKIRGAVDEETRQKVDSEYQTCKFPTDPNADDDRTRAKSFRGPALPG